MPSVHLIGLLLLTVSFTLATQIGLWREQSEHDRTRTGGVLEALMGDSRRLFANHFVTKADVYLHAGVYPSIFDQAQQEKTGLAHEAASPGSAPCSHGDGEHCDDDHGDHDDHGHPDRQSGRGGKPRDWIDSFGRNFYPTDHVHLGEKGNQREILPWLRLAAELNPNQDDIYPLAAYWLRQRMGKAKEAEEFLREGWRANPNSFAILFELGRLYEENHQDPLRARNLYEAALRYWRESEIGKEKPDDFACMQITGHLARLAEREGQFEQAVRYFELLKVVSPNPESIQRLIDAVRDKAALQADP